MSKPIFRAQLALGTLVVLCGRLLLTGCSQGGHVGMDGSVTGRLTWERRSAGTGADLVEVWGAGPGEVRVRAADGAEWRSLDGGDTFLRVVAPEPRPAAADEVWRRSAAASFGEAIAGACGVSASEGWAVAAPAGGGGVILHSRDGGASFDAVALEGGGLLGVWAAGVDEAFAVGEQGVVWRYGGREWAREVAPAAETLRAVWGDGAGTVFAVGDGGTIVRGR